MLLEQLLNMEELEKDLNNRKILMRTHPSLPLAILNYSNECMFENYWSDAVQKCRGLIIEHKDFTKGLTGKEVVISRPFHKFFNLDYEGQPEYHRANLPNVEPTITEKMDGWFGILWQYNGQIGVASRGSFTSGGAVWATERVQKWIKYGANEEFPKGYTPIFEIISKEYRIVVDYPFEGLVLLGCVNNETGEELPYDELRNIWAKIASYAKDTTRPWLRLVKAHSMSLLECESDKKENFEGYVLTYPRLGTYPIKVKVKLEEYRELHRVITNITPKAIRRRMENPLADLLKPHLPSDFREWVHTEGEFLLTSLNSHLESTHLLLNNPDIKEVISKNDLLSHEGKKHIFAELEFYDSTHARAAMQILEGRISMAYASLWEMVWNTGENIYYQEGEGE